MKYALKGEKQTMKKIFRGIITFLAFLGISILPTLIFVDEQDRNFMLHRPEYWIASVIVAAVISWQFMQDNNSKK